MTATHQPTTPASIGDTDNDTAPLIKLPYDGFSRASQLLPFVGIGLSTLWKWTRAGKFPQPIKISPTITAWKNKDVHAWLNQQAQLADSLPASNDDTNAGGVA